MLKFDFESQAHSNPPQQFPLKRESALPELYLVLHPRCPCSSVSLEAFARILERVKGKTNAVILFVKPSAGLDDTWVQSKLWESAQKLSDVSIVIDGNGETAKRFDAVSSGQVLLYGTDGNLKFSGGLNEARGQQGSGRMEDKVVSLIKNTGETTETQAIPALGCPLHDKECDKKKS